MNKIMVLKGGSPAIHKLGNISRERDDYEKLLTPVYDSGGKIVVDKLR